MANNNIKDEIVRLLEITNLSSQEKKTLLQYLNEANESELQSLMEEYFVEETHELLPLNIEIAREILQNIHEKIGRAIEAKKRRAVIKMRILRIAAAACIIGLLGSIAYFRIINPSTKAIAKNESSKANKNDIMPSGTNAVLTLSDGSVILLDSAQNGVLAKQGNTKVVKYNGQLSYGASKAKSVGILYNTISTLRGGQYQVILPDGSQVWLNAESSLRFPTAFTGKERTVEITGEAYFEVAKNKAMPFVVNVNGAQVEVLGTHFDIMAYADEAAVKTTLMEGSVKFIKNGISSILKPGQQAQLSKKDDKVKVVDNVDVEDVMAWKNGLFRFRGEDIGIVLRQLTRWYDVEVVYNEKINDLFYAEMPRNTKLEDVLKALTLTGKVHFQLDDKKIIVSP